MVNTENTKSEVKSNTKRTIDEVYEEIINEIQIELTNIEQVKKQIVKIRKRFKLPDLSHLTWSQLNVLESSCEQSINNKLLNTLEHEIGQFRANKKENKVEGEYLNKLVSFAKKGTDDGTCFNIFSSKLLHMLDIGSKSTFNEFIRSTEAAVDADQLSNPVLNEVSKSYFLEILDNFRKNNALTTNEKEHLSELFILLASSKDLTLDLGHPSLDIVNEYLDTNNLACGLNHVSIGSGQGYDHLIITVEDGSGFRKLSRFNPIELKWRTSNTRDWLQPSNIRRQMCSSFRKSIEKLYSIDGLPVGAYKVSKNGRLKFIADTGFSMYTTFGRGNDGLLKLNLFNEQFNELAKSWKKINVGKQFPLHQFVPDSGGKTLQECFINAIREQCFLEGLIENGFMMDYIGDLHNYNQITYLPKRSYTFEFNSQTGVFSKTLSDSDFKMFGDYYPKSLTPSNLSQTELEEEGIVVDRYYSFVLSEDTDFMDKLGLEPEYYRIFITDNVIPRGIILTPDKKIVCSEEYYFKNKQDLIAEIKTRCANDFRDGKKLTKWNGIVTEDFLYTTDLAFFTANPHPLSKTENTYRFHPNLHKPKGEVHILGLDRVYCYALRIECKIVDEEKKFSDWFQITFKKFTSREIKTDNVIVLEDIFDDADKYARSYFEGYGEIPTRTFFAEESYCFKSKKIAQKLINKKLKMHPHINCSNYDINTLMQKNDVFDEAYKLFSGDAKYRYSTIVDETFTVSKESGYRKVDRKNLIRADWFDTKTFAKRDEIPCYVTIIRKLDKSKQSKRVLTLEGQTNLYRLKTK